MISPQAWPLGTHKGPFADLISPPSPAPLLLLLLLLPPCYFATFSRSNHLVKRYIRIPQTTTIDRNVGFSIALSFNDRPAADRAGERASEAHSALNLFYVPDPTAPPHAFEFPASVCYLVCSTADKKANKVKIKLRRGRSTQYNQGMRLRCRLDAWPLMSRTAR